MISDAGLLRCSASAGGRAGSMALEGVLNGGGEEDGRVWECGADEGLVSCRESMAMSSGSSSIWTIFVAELLCLFDMENSVEEGEMGESFI